MTLLRDDVFVEHSRSGRRLPRVVLLGVLFVLLGCGNPFVDEFTVAKVQPSELLGRYVPGSTFGGVNAATQDYTVIDLRDDGKCAVTNYARKTVEGTWELEICQTGQEWRCVRVSAPGLGSFPINLIGTNAPYELHVTVGDPDEGKAYRLKKEAIVPAP